MKKTLSAHPKTALLKRLEEFRKLNTPETTVMNYFDEKEVHPIVLSTETNTLEQVFAILLKKFGKPHNYGPSEEQLAEKKKKDAEEKVRATTREENRST